jgi:hypothetical protein
MAWLQRAAISAKPWGLGGAARNLNKLKCKKKSKRKVSQIRLKNQKVKASWTMKRSRHRKLVKRGFQTLQRKRKKHLKLLRRTQKNEYIPK